MIENAETSLLYDPMQRLQDDWEELFPHIVDSSQMKENYKKRPKQTDQSCRISTNDSILSYRQDVRDLLVKLKKDKIKFEVEKLDQLLEVDEVDKHFVRSLKTKLVNVPISHKYISLIQYTNLIELYINSNKSKQLDYEDLRKILHYLYLAFEPMSRTDFPYFTINKAKIDKLISFTTQLPDEHPLKWTSDRYQNIRKERDYYKKRVYFDDYLYLWFKFIKDSNTELINKNGVVTKYVLDAITKQVCRLYSSKFIVFNLYEDTTAYDRIKEFYDTTFEIVANNKERFNIQSNELITTNFLLPEQIENQFMIKDGVDIKKDVLGPIGRISPKSRDVFQFMLEHNQLEKVVIIEEGQM